MSTIAVDAARTDSRSDPDDQRPLTDDERKFVARMFSDPFAFPQMYKTWLISFREGSDLSLPLSSILGLTSLLGTGGGGSPGIFKLLPAGMLFAWGGTTVPQGTVECNGQALNRITYDRLFKAIGTGWGAGDGVNTFNVPDVRRRSLWGAGSGRPVGTTDGVAEGTRGGHAHSHSYSINSDLIPTPTYHEFSGATDWEPDHQHDLYSAGHGANDAPNVFQGLHYLGYEGGAVTNPNGGHDHGVSVSGNVSAAGRIQVSGVTGGGGQQDLLSHAYVMYVINT